MNPVFGHGHLRLYLLSLLAERPRHGYELIQALSERFGGTYSPSAGTIYPRLAKLEDEGLVTKSSDGRKTVYEITDAGRAELAARSDDLDSIEDKVTDSVRMLADTVRAGVDQAMKSLRADLASAAREASSGDFLGGAKGGAWYGTKGGAAGASTADAGAETPDAATGPEGADAAAKASTASSTTAFTAASAAASDRRRNQAEALRETEAALDGFRAKVRVELRRQAAKGPLPEPALSAFADALTRAHDQLRADLSR